METQSGCEKTAEQLVLFAVWFCLRLTGCKGELNCGDRSCKHNLWWIQVVGENVALFSLFSLFSLCQVQDY